MAANQERARGSADPAAVGEMQIRGLVQKAGPGMEKVEGAVKAPAGLLKQGLS